MTTPALRNEVVTHALVRYVHLPGTGGPRFALITVDNGHDHTRPNTFGPDGLRELAVAIDQVAAAADRGDIAGIGVVGKPFGFAAGADLPGITAVANRAAAVAIGQQGHDTFRRLGELSVPSFGFINGAALGGGLELALHCTYRTVSRGVTAIALPECFLGLVPGWGGTQLLPRIIGPNAAVTVIIENPLANNRMMSGTAAHSLGIADAIFDSADFLERSVEWAAEVIGGNYQVARHPVATADQWASALARGRAITDATVHGAAPAPYQALELLALSQTADRDSGFEAEDAALANLLMGEELRASLYSFDLVRRRARRPAGAPDLSLARPITKVGIVGAGLMASQLALLFLRRLQVPVVLTDIDPGQLDRAVTTIGENVTALTRKGRLSVDTARRLSDLVTSCPDLAGFADVDLVIEAVSEDLSVKQQVFTALEAVVNDSCILATNTSSLSVTAMAVPLRHPERVVGLHFFNPVAVMPLVEIARAAETNDATTATACAVVRQLKKSAVLVGDAPAFVVNRLLNRCMGEIFRAIDDGTPLEVADAALDPLGLPITPMTLLTLVGPAVALHVSRTLSSAFPDRFAVSENLSRLVDAGLPGVYSGEGTSRQIHPDVEALYRVGSHPVTGETIRDRAMAALALEARLLLDEGVVADPRDIDLCLLLGAGWPFHLGGITPYLDRTGVAERVTGQRFLPYGVASLPSPTSTAVTDGSLTG
jgi:3-hydroxyacyl-CoA dehydrogenase/enoyl-CoA hydratase/carnithine racemase